MKYLLTLILSGLILISHAQVHQDELTKELSFEKASDSNVLYVTNINGGVEVEGYNGDKIKVRVSRTIKAKTLERLEQGLNEIRIGIMDRYDTLIVYMKGGCDNFRWNGTNQGYNWDYSECNPPYDYKFDITLMVPQGINVYASTVNQGDIKVSGVSGTLELRNINGDIAAIGIQGSTIVHAINGDIHLEYTSIPESGSFYSLNGDINANYPSKFRASVTFKSFNGDFYTNIDDIVQQPVIIKTTSDKKGITFKAETRTAISFRGGGPPLDFETFNGDVFIKEVN